jgi:hypothetical protein
MLHICSNIGGNEIKRFKSGGTVQRDKAEAATQTTALGEPCEYPVGRVTKEEVERRMRSVATGATTF